MAVAIHLIIAKVRVNEIFFEPQRAQRAQRKSGEVYIKFYQSFRVALAVLVTQIPKVGVFPKIELFLT